MAISPAIRHSFLGLALSLFVIGLIIISVSASWLNSPDDLRDGVVSQQLLIGGIVVGIFICLSVFPGLWGNLSPIRRKRYIIVYMFLVVFSTLGDLALATSYWFLTLRLRTNFGTVWGGMDTMTKTNIQESMSCCGYTSPADDPALTSVCSPSSTLSGCAGPITADMNSLLIAVYTTLYAFPIVGVLSVLSAIILVYARNDEERFLRIEKKRRGGDRALNLQYV